MPRFPLSSGLRAGILLVAFLLTGLLLATGCGSRSPSTPTSETPASDVAATVNGETISQKELDAELNKLKGEEVLQTLIDARLINQAAKKEKIEVKDDEVKARLDELKKNPQYAALAKSQRLEDKDLEARIRNLLALQKLVLLEVPDREKLKLYDNYREQLEQAHVYHILIPLDKKDDAVKIEGMLKQGQDFETLARQFSKDEVSKGQGGDLGWVPRGARLDPAFMKVAFTIPLNQVSAPVKTQGGYSILKVVARKKSYDELKSDIEDRLVSMQQGQYIQRLRVKAEVRSKFDTGLSRTSPGAASPTASTPTVPTASPGAAGK